MGVKVYKTPYVYGEPIEYMYPTSQQTFALYQLAKQGSTGAGKLDYQDGTSQLRSGAWITMKATTGSSQELIPVLRVNREITYIVDHCSSEAVVGTSAVGYFCSISSSGGALVGTTGGFRVTALANTSDTSAQKVIGNFLFTDAPTTE